MSSANSPKPLLPGGEGAFVPYPASRRRVVTFLAVLPWPLILFQYLFVLPRYDKLFRQYNVYVDGWTAICLNVSAWVRNYSVFSFIATLMLTACCVMTANLVLTLPFSRPRRSFFLLLDFGLPCALFIVSWLGVLSTHSKLVEGLQR